VRLVADGTFTAFSFLSNVFRKNVVVADGTVTPAGSDDAEDGGGPQYTPYCGKQYCRHRESKVRACVKAGATDTDDIRSSFLDGPILLDVLKFPSATALREYVAY
jgi:hypothetical protein